MKYISIDIETARLDQRSPDGILMASFVVEDPKNPLPLDQLPSFTCLIAPGPTIAGPVSLMAMAMNAWLMLAIDFKQGKQTMNQYEVLCRRCGIPQPTIDRAMTAAAKYPLMDLATFIAEANKFFDKHFAANQQITVAGKNAAGFDLMFMPKEISRRFHNRVLDPGSVYVDIAEDDCLPSSEKVLERSGMGTNTVSHDAHDDAMMVIATLRPRYARRMFT